MLSSPLPFIRNKDDIQRLVESPDERSLLLSPFANFQSFYRSYCQRPSLTSNSTFGYRQVLQKGDFSVAVVGINTAWLGGFNLNVQKEVDDCRHLCVSEFQLRNCTLGRDQLMIVLMHHPSDWLMETDQLLVEQLFANRRAIVLRGHLHRPDLLATSNLDGQYLTIPAGSVFDRRTSPNAYNFVQVDLDSGRGEIHLRRYNDRRGEWQKDTDSTGDKLDGIFPFVIPGKKTTVKAFAPFPFRSIRSADCELTDQCREDLRILGLSEDQVISLVRIEFENHSNYRQYDLDNYPLPLDTSYIVYIDKIGQKVTFRHLVSSTRNQDQLVAWNSIVAQYQRLVRLSYREDPSELAFIKGKATRASELHVELTKMMRDYYMSFEIARTRSPNDGLADTSAKAAVDPAQVNFHLDASKNACVEVRNIAEAIKAEDIDPTRAVGLLVASLEQSLQHIHKLILLYPPRAE